MGSDEWWADCIAVGGEEWEGLFAGPEEAVGGAVIID
jgi:hypothetical protein